MTDLNRVALVTGASRGLGQAISESLLIRGFSVVGVSRGESAISDEKYMHFEADLLETHQVGEIFRKLKKSGVHIDTLINNAGVLTSQYALILDPERAREMVLTNLWAPFVISREAARAMRRKGWGRVVHIGSMAATLEVPGDSIYAATKQGLVTFSNLLAKELACFGVTSNVLGVSAFQSGMLSDLPQDQISDVISKLLIPREASIEDVMNVLDFFISPESDYITAQTVYLAGAH